MVINQMRAAIICVVVFTGILGLPLAAETAEDGRHHIAIRDFAFVPAHIDIRAGDAITWTNEDDTQHSAWDMNDRFDTGILAQGKTATFVFSKPGTYYYRSRPYGETRGTITVTR